MLDAEENKKRQQEQFETVFKAQEDKKLQRYRELLSMSNIGRRYIYAWFTKLIREQENENAIMSAQEFVKDPKFINNGLGLYLYGDCGTGKTHLACCILNALMYNGVPCKINTIDNIKSEIMSSGFQQGGADRVVNEYSWVKVLVIDDIGTEQFTYNGQMSSIQQQIFSIINNRYKNMLPTIYTSNYSLEELQKKGLEKKITDRIFETTSAFIEIKGKNKRI